MREILFKAKAINRDKGYHRTNYKNGDWVYGLITRLYDEQFENLPAEMTDENGVSRIEVDHNTICQYTGLTDKNGNKIWENDVVFVTDGDGNSGQIDTGLGEIEFLEGLWYICGRVQNSLYDVNRCFLIEVIGNIFDNHELLKGGAE